MAIERELAKRMYGTKNPSVLMTDGYKFSMGQAGFPLRRETFYLSFRKPGRYFVPFDLAEVVKEFCDLTGVIDQESRFLSQYKYDMTPAMRAAYAGELDVWSAPAGTWVREGEPFLTVTAPSFLASWLEPMVLWLQYPIQVATEAKLHGRRQFVCTCNDERSITMKTLRALGMEVTFDVSVDTEAYLEGVEKNWHSVAGHRPGQNRSVNPLDPPNRIIEVGMRGATCMQMHEIALERLRSLGLRKTSNVWLANKLRMEPVGTTGHEHQQRWGRDIDAFRAVRDMRASPPSYLFDTYDAEVLGIPAAIQAMHEDNRRGCSVRFDERDAMESQLRTLASACEGKLNPNYIFEDGMNAERTERIEGLATVLNIPAERRFYGFGGFFISEPAPTDLTRNRVSAVYKLSDSGGPVMKFAPGKNSIPGVPRIFRRIPGADRDPIGHTLPNCLIGQKDEVPPRGWAKLTPDPTLAVDGPVGLSPATAVLVRSLEVKQQGLR